MCSPCLFNLFVKYILRKAVLEEGDCDFKVGERNINNLQFADNTTLIVENAKGSEVLVRIESEGAK